MSIDERIYNVVGNLADDVDDADYQSDLARDRFVNFFIDNECELKQVFMMMGSVPSDTAIKLIHGDRICLSRLCDVIINSRLLFHRLAELQADKSQADESQTGIPIEVPDEN